MLCCRLGYGAGGFHGSLLGMGGRNSFPFRGVCPSFSGWVVCPTSVSSFYASAYSQGLWVPLFVL